LRTRPDKPAPKPEPNKRTVQDLPREIQGQLEQIQRQRAGGGGGEFESFIGDNSNTQFAILALWVARRYGLPVDGALGATEPRFRQSVTPDGGWSYTPSFNAPPPGAPPVGAPATNLADAMGSTPAMTCAGLLGVGVAYGAWNETALRTDP